MTGAPEKPGRFTLGLISVAVCVPMHPPSRVAKPIRQGSAVGAEPQRDLSTTSNALSLPSAFPIGQSSVRAFDSPA